MRKAPRSAITRLVGFGASLAFAPLALAQVGDFVGDPEQGKALFTERLCYACHGFSGETGVPLIPLLPREAFVVIVRSPPMRQMPAYVDLSPQQVAHIYAYLESLPAATPPLAEIPLLNAIIEQAEALD